MTMASAPLRLMADQGLAEGRGVGRFPPPHVPGLGDPTAIRRRTCDFRSWAGAEVTSGLRDGRLATWRGGPESFVPRRHLDLLIFFPPIHIF